MDHLSIGVCLRNSKRRRFSALIRNLLSCINSNNNNNDMERDLMHIFPKSKPLNNSQESRKRTNKFTDSMISMNTSFFECLIPSCLHETAFVTAIGTLGATSSLYPFCVIYLKNRMQKVSEHNNCCHNDQCFSSVCISASAMRPVQKFIVE